MSLSPNQIIISPRFIEVDMMEVVHHSKYWIWFEESRWNFLSQILNINIITFREQEILMPVIDCACKYKKSVRWTDIVIIETKLEVTETSNFHFTYTAFAQGKPHEMFSVASTRHVIIDNNFKLKLYLPALLRERINTMRQEKPYAFIK